MLQDNPTGKEAPTQVHYCEFCEMLQNSVFAEHLRTT